MRTPTFGEGDGPDSSGLQRTCVGISSTEVTLADDVLAAILGSVAIPAGTFAVGDAARVTAYGVYGTGLAGVSLELKVTTGSGGSVYVTTGAVTAAPGLANRGWKAEAVIIAKAASVEAQGVMFRSTAANAGIILDMENTGPVGTALDNAASLEVVAQWGAADPANTITLRQMIVERLAA